MGSSLTEQERHLNQVRSKHNLVRLLRIVGFKSPNVITFSAFDNGENLYKFYLQAAGLVLQIKVSVRFTDQNLFTNHIHDEIILHAGPGWVEVDGEWLDMMGAVEFFGRLALLDDNYRRLSHLC